VFLGFQLSAEIKQRLLRFLREDEEFRYAVAGMTGLDEILRRKEVHDEKFAEIVKRLDTHEEELVKLREDMHRGFEHMDRHLTALGARWGLMAEETFREGLRGPI